MTIGLKLSYLHSKDKVQWFLSLWEIKHCTLCVFTQSDFFIGFFIGVSGLCNFSTMSSFSIGCFLSTLIVPSTLHISEPTDIWHTWLKMNGNWYQLVWNLAAPSPCSLNIFSSQTELLRFAESQQWNNYPQIFLTTWIQTNSFLIFCSQWVQFATGTLSHLKSEEK